MSTQDLPHHTVHVDVGQDRSFNGALAKATGNLEPRAKLIFGTNSITSVRAQVPKNFDDHFGYASATQGTPQASAGNTVEALFEINASRVPLCFRAPARLDHALQNDEAKGATTIWSKPVRML